MKLRHRGHEHELSRPAGATTVIDVFFDNVQTLGDRPALRRHVDGEWRSVTWRAYGDDVRRIVAGLAELGVEPGDRVALLSSNRVEWHEADLGIIAGGAVTVPVYPTSASSQVAFVMGHAGAKVAFVEDVQQLSKLLLRRAELPALERIVVLTPSDGLDGELLLSWDALLALGSGRLEREPELVDARRRAIRSDDLMTLVYTSGTTGPPKGTMLTHGNVMAAVRAITSVVSVGPEDRFLSFLPLSHIAERTISHFGQIVAGGETWFARSLATVRDDLQSCRPTVFFAVPRVWEKLRDGIVEGVNHQHGVARRLADRYLALSRDHAAAAARGGHLSLVDGVAHRVLDRVIGAKVRRTLGLDQARVLASGAAPVHPDLLRFFAALGLPIAEGYGQTEDSAPTSMNPPGRIRIGSVGQPMPGVDVRIAADGEILVRGANVTPGYFRDDEATAELLDAGGWMHSGDLGFLDDDGYLFVTGRKKDLIINSAGKNISPQEIETRLRFEPLIGQAVVVGDGRPYLTALLTLDAETAAAWAAEHGELAEMEELARDPDVLAEIQRSVDRVNAEHARVEGIKRWTLLPQDLTIAGGELTPTLKVKRQVVAERYAELIDQLYAG